MTLAVVERQLEDVADFLNIVLGVFDEMHPKLMSALVKAHEQLSGLGCGQSTIRLGEFIQASSAISIACRNVASEMKARRIRGGRPPLIWYDSFLEILLNLAIRTRIRPRLGKDRETELLQGWLIDAAQGLELFLEPSMRSSSSEACAKRLQRALKQMRHSALYRRALLAAKPERSPDRKKT